MKLTTLLFSIQVKNEWVVPPLLHMPPRCTGIALLYAIINDITTYKTMRF